jgi:hypothetical protein
MEDRKTIVLVLYSSRDFGFRDVELIARHINGKWKSSIRPRIICLWNNASEYYDLGNIEIIPLHTSPGVVGTWSRIQLYSPKMEQYKPFLYVDLDTAIIQSLENIFDLVKDPDQFITLEDFWQRGQIATGLVWFPKNCKQTQKIYESFTSSTGPRMDLMIRKLIGTTVYWQSLTKTIVDFKPRKEELLQEIPDKTDLVCFHGKPRVFDAVNIPWVNSYVNIYYNCSEIKYKATVIIPYNRDRGWLQQAINSVPDDVQLILSQGEGNWPENFNKVFDQVQGKYVRWLHEDDMLTKNSIGDAIKAIEEQNVDFIHGNAIEMFEGSSRKPFEYIPNIATPTCKDLIRKNILHSATLLYKREVFEKVGMLDETLNTAEEYEFNLRCLKFGLKIGYCNSFLAYYRRHARQKVRLVPAAEKRFEREKVQKKYRA